MPYYDRTCTVCDWQAVDLHEPIDPPTVPPCPACDAPTARAWLTKPPNAVGDECDFVEHNGTKTPIRFRSKIEFKRWLKEQGLRVVDSHVSMEGTDKAEHTTAWTAGGKDWLAKAEAAAKAHHNGGFLGNEPTYDPPLNIQWLDMNTGLPER